MIPLNPNLPGQEAAKIAARFAPGTRVDQVEDPDRVEIWDVRRHHISKYVLLGSEGACAGALDPNLIAFGVVVDFPALFLSGYLDRP